MWSSLEKAAGQDLTRRHTQLGLLVAAACRPGQTSQSVGPAGPQHARYVRAGGSFCISKGYGSLLISPDPKHRFLLVIYLISRASILLNILVLRIRHSICMLIIAFFLDMRLSHSLNMIYLYIQILYICQDYSMTTGNSENSACVFLDHEHEKKI